MTECSKQGLATRSIHGQGLRDAHGSPHTPIYTTTTFAFASTADLLDVVEGRKAGQPLHPLRPESDHPRPGGKLAGLEGAEAAWAFCSGMAAETALFLTHGREGIVCIGDAYGGTLELLASQLPLLGIPTHLLLGSETGPARRPAGRRRALVFLRDADQPDPGGVRHPRHRRTGPRPRRPGGGGQHLRLAGQPAPAAPRRGSRRPQRHQVSGRPQRPHRRRPDGRQGAAEPVWNWRKNLGIDHRRRRPPPCCRAACAPWWCGCASRTPRRRRWPKRWRATRRSPGCSIPGSPTSPAMRWRSAQMHGFGGM